MREALKRVDKGELPAFQVCNVICSCRNKEKLIGKGKIFELKSNYPGMKAMLFDELRSRFTSSSGFWMGYPEYSNLDFRSFVNDLGKMDTDSIGQYPQIEDHIIQELILAQITGSSSHF